METAQRLLSLLPAIYREDAFTGRYLWAFEQVLLGLEQKIGSIARLFDPLATDKKFLPWLATWVAFTMRSDLEENQQRNFLAGLVPLYRRRGTKRNLEELLSIFTPGVATVDDTALPPGGGTGAHYFVVTVRWPTLSPEFQERQVAIARALIELEKPAHTYYDLRSLSPALKIGKTSHVGVDTLLGTASG